MNTPCECECVYIMQHGTGCCRRRCRLARLCIRARAHHLTRWRLKWVERIYVACVHVRVSVFCVCAAVPPGIYVDVHVCDGYAYHARTRTPHLCTQHSGQEDVYTDNLNITSYLTEMQH